MDSEKSLRIHKAEPQACNETIQQEAIQITPQTVSKAQNSVTWDAFEGRSTKWGWKTEGLIEVYIRSNETFLTPPWFPPCYIYILKKEDSEKEFLAIKNDNRNKMFNRSFKEKVEKPDSRTGSWRGRK